MSRIELLRGSRDSYAVRWRDFIRKCRAHPGALHCFFEGADAKYFGLRIELIAKSEFIEYRCGGKAGVLRLLELIAASPSHAEQRVRFFVDRDFDPPEAHPDDARLYVTDGYSIENHYVTSTALTRILKGEYGLDPLDDEDELVAVVERCTTSLNGFVEEVRQLNAWVAAVRTEERAGVHVGRLNLGSRSVANFVAPSLEGNKRKYALEDLPELFGMAGPADETLAERLEALGQCDGLVAFRGKWMLEALRKYLDELQNDRRSKAPSYFARKGKAALQLSKENLVSELSQYADTPDSLRAFLEEAKAA
jgi:hypothetical protein